LGGFYEIQRDIYSGYHDGVNNDICREQFFKSEIVKEMEKAVQYHQKPKEMISVPLIEMNVA
jgi:hypothetical protein